MSQVFQTKNDHRSDKTFWYNHDSENSDHSQSMTLTASLQEAAARSKSVYTGVCVCVRVLLCICKCSCYTKVCLSVRAAVFSVCCVPLRRGTDATSSAYMWDLPSGPTDRLSCIRNPRFLNPASPNRKHAYYRGLKNCLYYFGGSFL